MSSETLLHEIKSINNHKKIADLGKEKIDNQEKNLADNKEEIDIIENQILSESDKVSRNIQEDNMNINKHRDKIYTVHNEVPTDEKKTESLDNEIIFNKEDTKNQGIEPLSKKIKMTSVCNQDNENNVLLKSLIIDSSNDKEESVQQKVSSLKQSPTDKSVITGKFTKITLGLKSIYKYRGAVHVDGKIYFTPFEENSIGVLDINENIFSTISLGTEISEWYKFSSSVVVDNEIYFTPNYADYIGILDIKTNLFSTLNIEKYVSGIGKFTGAVHIDDKIYFTPFSTTFIGVLDINKKEFSTINIDNHVKGVCEFSGCVVVDRKVYFVPFFSDVIGILNIDTEHFSTINISSNNLTGIGKFGGAVIANKRIYFVPHGSNYIGVLDVVKNIFSTVSLDGIVTGEYKFFGAVVISQRIIFSPDDCDIFVSLDTNTMKVSNVNIQCHISRLDFKGCVAVNNKMYLSPSCADYVGILSFSN